MFHLFARMLRRARPVGAPERPPARAVEALPSGFEGLALVCKLEQVVPQARNAEEAAADSLLADQIFSHYEVNRPGPESMPSVSLQILNLLAAPKMDAQRLATMVSHDPALAANVLRVANSALHKGVSEIETVRDAIARLGLEELARLAGAISARSLFNPKLRAQFASHDARFKRLFEDALTDAMASAWLALRKPGVNSGRAYLGGLLHDVGKSIALRSVTALEAEGKIAPRPDAIARALEQLHTVIGEDAARAWALPGFLVGMAAHHHDGQAGADEIIDLSAVRLVSALRALKAKDPEQPSASRELTESAQVLGVTPLELRTLDAEMLLFAARASSLTA